MSSRSQKFHLSKGKARYQVNEGILPQFSYNLNNSPGQVSNLLSERNLSVSKSNCHLTPLRNKNFQYKAELKRLQNGEKNWDTHFHLMWSKDNDLVTKSKRELFEFPLLYNLDGTKLLI